MRKFYIPNFWRELLLYYLWLNLTTDFVEICETIKNTFIMPSRVKNNYWGRMIEIMWYVHIEIHDLFSEIICLEPLNMFILLENAPSTTTRNTF